MTKKFRNRIRVIWTRYQNISRTTSYSFFVITIAAIFYVLGTQSIMKAAAILPSGIVAIVAVTTYVVPETVNYYSLMYFILNIPILLFFLRKVKTRYVIKTTYFLGVTLAIGALFIIPEVGRTFDTFIINDGVKRASMHQEEIANYNSTGELISTATAVSRTVWPKIVLPAVGALFIGFSQALAYKHGGSSGGVDILFFYLATRKKMNTTAISWFLTVGFMAIAFAVQMAVLAEQRAVWLPSILGTFIYIILSNLVVGTIYPKYAKVNVEVHSKKIDEIKEYLKNNLKHSYRINNGVSGYTGNTIAYISSVMLLLETKDFIREMRTIDDKVWISITRVSNVVGNFDISGLEKKL